MANLYMTQEGQPWYVGATVAGSVVGAYWFCMMIGRLVGGAIGSKVSSRAMITGCSVVAIALVLAAMFAPVQMVTVFGKSFPLSMCFVVLCGLCTSVMWGGIFNMAAEGLGKYVPMGSGIFMAMVFGGVLIPVQGMLADKIGILNSYWMTIALLAYVLFYALVGSKLGQKK
jgi:FHS family L-fucose permease-like MFS transporter